MFISDQIVFVELQKTGCTHIRNLLCELVGGELRDKHDQVPASLFNGQRRFLGSVRDPWEWYISLWAYGCDGRGNLFGRVTRDGYRLRGLGWRRSPLAALASLPRMRPNRHAAQWRRTLRDAQDPGAFREWLHMLHDRSHWHELGEGYAQTRLCGFAGLFTYRYLTLFACTRGEDATLRGIASPAALQQFEREQCFIDHFIRNERLVPDLLAALQASGIDVPAQAHDRIAARPRTNTSSRRHGAGYFYDEASSRLVADRDRLIVDRFGYTVPEIVPAARPQTRMPCAATNSL
jgi:hypothetical protein